MWQILFGAGTWGAGGNIVAWVICGIPTVLLGLWHHRRQMRKHISDEIAQLEHRLRKPGPR